MAVPPQPIAPDDDARLAERVVFAIEQQIAAADRLMEKFGVMDTTPRDLDSVSRALASITRTTRELVDMRRALNAQPAERPEDNEFPRDVEELRRELSRKLEALVAEQQGTLPPGV